ncbi:hypothetical protein [Fimbriiglobus ruber]|uniref:Uncharacterized protein n=1 Tax=Fimbriiglobus ruber TaxID=1908690 RepID=A0A225DUC7_9BACT|nr:hypothetical protein [Fimbriiglobus ruber]OWK43254.1 hypothetical protein FRUB_02853 [Fimbriiglobus ruber]
MLLAQQGWFGADGDGPMPDEARWAWLAASTVVLVVAFAGVQIAYLLTLSRCLQRVSPWNRSMQPDGVWLNLIPGFDIYWRFVTVNRLAESLRQEFGERQLAESGYFGRYVGLAYSALILLFGIVAPVPILIAFFEIPIVLPRLYLAPVFLAAWILCWIVYWVKIAGYSRQLLESSAREHHRLDR